MERAEAETRRVHEGHEGTDADVGALARLALLLIVVTLVVVASMLFLFRRIVSREAASDAVPSPLAASPAPFEGPRLEVGPEEALRNRRIREEEVLASYGWVDRERGVVRIPIERAKELLVERGLPSTRNPATERPR
jgi:hypothetical protein